MSTRDGPTIHLVRKGYDPDHLRHHGFSDLSFKLWNDNTTINYDELGRYPSRLLQQPHELWNEYRLGGN